MSVSEQLYSNLCLLGYDRETSPSKINISEGTFLHANERAFQSVVYFLFCALDEPRCRLTFRHCWPVLERRQAAAFRQAVVVWLKEIKQNDPDAVGLPLINSALFMSPGGRKFSDLLLAFTQFVLVKSIQNLDDSLPSHEVLLRRGDPETQCGTLRAASALARDRFVTLQRRRLETHNQHQQYSDSVCTQYRRLRQRVAEMTAELGRVVSVSELAPELTHRLLQQKADQVVPAVLESACQHLEALEPLLARLRQLSADTDRSWSVAESIVSGAVAESRVQASSLVTRPASDSQPQGVSDLYVGERLDLVAFLDKFVQRTDKLRQTLETCPIEQLKGVAGLLSPLSLEASQLSRDAARLLTELQAETESAGRHVDLLLTPKSPSRPQTPPPPPPEPAPVPLLAPRTPNWRLETAPPPPPTDHPLKHMYSAPPADGSQVAVEPSSDPEDRTGAGLTSSLFSPVAGRLPPISPCTVPSLGRPSAPAPAAAAAAAAAGDSRLSSCSSLFSPVSGRAERAAAASSADDGSAGSLLGGAAEGSERAPGPAAPGTPSLTLLRLRQRAASVLSSSAGSDASRAADATRSGSETFRVGSELSRLDADTSRGSETFRLGRGAPRPGSETFRLSSEAARAGSQTFRLGAPPPETGTAASGDGRRSPADSSAELARLRERTSALISSLARSPAPTAADRSRAELSALASPLADLMARSAELSELAELRYRPAGEPDEWGPTAGEQPSRESPNPASPDPASPQPSADDAAPDGSELPEPGSPQPLPAQPDPLPGSASGVTVLEQATDADFASEFSHTEDQMAEVLARSVFGTVDFNQSLNFSTRESLGGVELPLVPLDDSDCEPGPGEPPTDILIDI